ncbi:hypothetical protein ACFQH1_01000 [Lactiplantibacillus daoliensis]|uniref:Integral membrane protein n=1 Tax=Lactiplantibacillus daoliensis TaxID=2559916 RepID=A0ABW1UCE3_9LACO|nr:hypothetical protein [Lactiplantibacillus daoliensis]
MIIILMLGTAETIQFYLTNGSYFWFAILSFGFYLLLFFLPWLNLRLPYQKQFNLPLILLFNLSTGTVLLWIIALVNAPNRIYSDEGGVSSRPTNFMLKVITIVLLSAFYLVSLWLLVRAERRYQAERSQIEGQRPVPHSESAVGAMHDTAEQALKKQWHGRQPVAAKKIAIRFSMLPTLFVLMMLLLEQLLNDGSPQLLKVASLAVAIITSLIGLLSLIFLGEYQRRGQIIAVVVYTLLSLLNLSTMHLVTSYGFSMLSQLIRAGFEMPFKFYLAPIRQVGLIGLTILAWLVPYLLLCKKGKTSIKIQ